MPLIEVQNVTKTFRPRSEIPTLLAKGGAARLFRRRKRERTTALEEVTFTVERGESLGIIGANGSGKSTLLKILAGVTLPTSGHVTVRGRVASLLELGAGFQPLLSGRENVYLNARLLGMSRRDVDAVFDAIVEFSGVGEFIDNPVDTYSSGMYVRLGFSVAVHTNPDIFLVDEVLSVGDEEFQRKCRTRIGELKEQGKTIVFISHDLGVVNTLCDRVILLSKGKMISRGSPKETIDFYMRQIGREKGIHTFSADRVEAIMSHGRISLFHNRKELSAPSGFQVHLQLLEQIHPSTGADWEVVERGESSCMALGRMLRLPVTNYWEMRIENGRFVWKIAVDCDRETSLEAINATLFLPSGYTRWLYGEHAGIFPKHLPGDLSWTTVAPPELSCNETAALPDRGSVLPPVMAVLNSPHGFFRMQWSNSDYVLGARVLQAGARLPDAVLPLAPGRHELMTLEILLDATEENVRRQIDRYRTERILACGDVAARFENGNVRVFYKGEEITDYLCFYTSVLSGNLWNDSHHLVWGPAKRERGRLDVVGESRRFPFAQEWVLEEMEGGIGVIIWLHVRESFDAQEYHASIAVKTAYDRWETEHESGAFPAFIEGRDDWQHANRDYARGRFARVLSSALPSVKIEITTDAIAFRMTAINTGYFQQARVLQALRTPTAGSLHFEPGRHLFFAGLIMAGPEADR